MVSDEVGKQLHDRATRGGPLSQEEKAQLKDWYASQDQAEAAQLILNVNTHPTTVLQTQIDSAIAQLALAIERIQRITKENEALRGENVELRRRLGTPIMNQNLSGLSIVHGDLERKGVSQLVWQIAKELMKRRNLLFNDAIAYILEEGALELEVNNLESAHQRQRKEKEAEGVA